MATIDKQNRRSSRGQSDKSREPREEKKFNSLWSVFADAPGHSRLPFITEQLRAVGADIVSDLHGDRHTIVNKRHNPRMAKLAYSSVGSVVHVGNDKMTLLSYMSPRPTKPTENNFTRITRSFDDYTVYPISEGTTIGIYRYNDAWIIRTINGFDVGEYKWNGERTYQSVFDEVMDEYKDFSLDRLETNKCYTVGIKHSAFHPFKEGGDADIKRAWFIQSVDVEKVTAQNGSFANAVSRSDDIGIPIQKHLSGEDGTMRNIMMKKNSAYKNFIETGEVFYGVILISHYESIVIQSDLFEYIMTMFYTNSLNKSITAGGYDRQKYLALNTFLHANRANADRFQKLFPQFDDDVARFKSITSELVDAMINCIEEKKTEEKIPYQGRQLIFNNTVISLLRQLSNRAGGLPKLDMNIARMLSRFVRSTSHIATVYDLMYYKSELDSVTDQIHEECSLLVPEDDTST